MSAPNTPEGPRIVRRWIVGELIVAAMVAAAFATQCSRGSTPDPGEGSESSRASSPVAPAPAALSGSELAPSGRPTRVVDAGTVSAVEVVAARVRIHGRVTASEAGPAIVGTVAVQRWIDRKMIVVASSALDADGRYDVVFALDPPTGPTAPDRMSVFVVAADWGPGRVWLEVPRAGEYEQDVRLEPGRITGHVVDAAGGEVAGLDLRAGVPWSRDDLVDMSLLGPKPEDASEGAAARTVTDAHGRFELRGLSANEHRLFSASPEWFLKPVKASPGDFDVECVAVPAISIAGVVRDARSKDPVEATVFLAHMRSTHVGDTTTTAFQEFPVATRAGRFQFIVSVPGADEDLRYAVRAIPVSPDFTEAPRVGPFAREERRHEVELLVERLGSGVLLLDATTLGGAAYDGPIQVYLLPRGRQGGQREPAAVRERAGRYRIPVPSELDWDALVYAVAPGEIGAGLGSPPVRLPVRVRDGGEVVVRAAFPRFGHLRLKWAGDGVSAKVEALDAGRSGSLTNQMTPGMAPPPEGIRNTVPEGRYRVSLVGGPTESSREVEVKADEETLVDLR